MPQRSLPTKALRSSGTSGGKVARRDRSGPSVVASPPETPGGMAKAASTVARIAAQTAIRRCPGGYGGPGCSFGAGGPAGRHAIRRFSTRCFSCHSCPTPGTHRVFHRKMVRRHPRPVKPQGAVCWQQIEPSGFAAGPRAWRGRRPRVEILSADPLLDRGNWVGEVIHALSTAPVPDIEKARWAKGG